MIAMKQGNVVNSGKPEKLLTSGFLRDVYDIEVRVLFEEGFPLIIPKTRRKIDDYRK